MEGNHFEVLNTTYIRKNKLKNIRKWIFTIQINGYQNFQLYKIMFWYFLILGKPFNVKNKTFNLTLLLFVGY